ncbi:MAG: hypothetical protein ACREFE_15030 [Limisphaerales bacterium]
MRVSAFVLILISCLLLVSCSRNKFPSIQNSETLRQDCLNLRQQFPITLPTNLFQGELPTNNLPDFRKRVFQKGKIQKIIKIIPKEKWPESVQKLRPISVTSDFYGIYITTATNVDNKPFFWRPGKVYQYWLSEGYFVQCNQTSSVPESSVHGFGLYDMKRTQFNGIDEFYQPWAIQ